MECNQHTNNAPMLLFKCMHKSVAELQQSTIYFTHKRLNLKHFPHRNVLCTARDLSRSAHATVSLTTTYSYPRPTTIITGNSPTSTTTYTSSSHGQPLLLPLSQETLPYLFQFCTALCFLRPTPPVGHEANFTMMI